LITSGTTSTRIDGLNLKRFTEGKPVKDPYVVG
jgi:hypothetical protein